MTTLKVRIRYISLFALAIAAVAMTVGVSAPAKADPAVCQVHLTKQLFKYKKRYLKYQRVCLEKENVGKIPGPCPPPGCCPDAATLLKIQAVNDKVVASIEAACQMSDITALGFPANCAFEAAPSGIEATCAALPVTTVKEFVECLKCWKGAELSEFLALLYASHAQEVCGGALDETSSRCSDLDCTTPLPDQRNLGDTGQNDCQKGIGRRGIKYLVKRERVLEKCVLAGGTQAGCLADLTVQTKLNKIELSKQVGIQNKCGNRAPNPSPPFCCKTGNPQLCSAAMSRDDCTMNLGGTVVDNKTCSAGSCVPLMGNNFVTWWGFCPESDTCPGTALTTREDMVACIDSSADRIVDELLCLQFPTTWTCPVDNP